jgi:hypothetical protein
MARKVQSILIVDYNGPQGSRELTTVEDATINRSKPRTKVKTMNRDRVPIAFQTGTEDVNVSMTIIPELNDPEIDWHRAWKNDEEFQLVIEKGLEGTREQIVDCLVADINDTANENGDARIELTIEGLISRNEPG